MLNPQQIHDWINAGLPCSHIVVDGDGQHFEALIVSGDFDGLSRVKRQQLIYAILRERLDSGELHALSMQTLTPAEWEARGRG